jgi:hypothetical protein
VIDDATLREHHAFVSTDNAFQRRARILQTLWREAQRLPIGEHRGRPLGSRLVMPDAQTGLTNYLTDNIRDVVRREVLDPKRSAGKLFGRPRIFNDLLSSQPLCFNLFGELSLDLALASRVFADLAGGRIATVTAIGFEHSPGRGDAKYTGDRSAFDVFVEYVTSGRRGFLGVEVKYHEALGDPQAPHRSRYDEIAERAACFAASATVRLKASPLQQIWRDHLLAHALVQSGEYDEGTFAFLYPRENGRCVDAVAAYRTCVKEPSAFEAWTLEDVAEAVRRHGGGSWVGAFVDRYLAFQKIGRVAK